MTNHTHCTKTTFSTRDFFSKRGQILGKLSIFLVIEKSLMENLKTKIK